ncbi:MAG: hypothetical protein JO093_14770 [Acidobacteria bacterium]|nr:hypothetical protein [Acidobacteriota bacterium]MBV9068485.1 hypothetical protein [Acidobacteriota bacterium]MBV9186877.1 hypothetical protein [Acidobacteriota bacterium]
MAFVDRVADLFDEQHIPFALIGAEALAVRGVPRSSYDVDLLTVDARVLSNELWEPIRTLTNIEIRRGDLDDPLKGVVKIRPPKEKSIDVVVGRWKWQQRVIERAEPMPSEERMLPTVTTTDLILLKLDAGGPQDAWDVTSLLAVAPEKVIAEVEERLADLKSDAKDLWQRIRRGA